MLLWVLLTVSNCKKLKRPGQTLKDKKTSFVRDHDYDYDYYEQRDNFNFEVSFWEPGPCSTGQPGCLPKSEFLKIKLRMANVLQMVLSSVP